MMNLINSNLEFMMIMMNMINQELSPIAQEKLCWYDDLDDTTKALGRTWQLKNTSIHGIAAPADAVGLGQDGTMPYSQVLEFNHDHNATTVYDDVLISSYSYAGNVWIGYDDVNTVKTKVEFAKAREIGGYFFWALGDDQNWTLSDTDTEKDNVNVHLDPSKEFVDTL